MTTNTPFNPLSDISKQDPKQTLLADKWPTMSLSELYKQRDILTKKVSMALDMMERGGSDAVRQLYVNLNAAEQQLNYFIELKESGELNDNKRIHGKGHKTFK